MRARCYFSFSERYREGYENGEMLGQIEPAQAKEEMVEKYTARHFDPERRGLIGSLFKLWEPEETGFTHGILDALEDHHPETYEELLESEKSMEIDYW